MESQFFVLKMLTQYNVWVFGLNVTPTYYEHEEIVECLKSEFGLTAAHYHQGDNEIRVPDPPDEAFARLNEIGERINQILSPRHFPQ